MGISKQEMPTTSFDEDLKKQGSAKKGTLELSKKNLGFIVFAIVILQVADAGLQWLVGGSTSGNDTAMYAIMVFSLSKLIYSKYLAPDAKVSEEGTLNEAEERPATMVKDTMKARPFRQSKDSAPRAPKTSMPTDQKSNWVPRWLKESVPNRLNAKAKKFVPEGPSNVLDSDAPVFLPTPHQVEDYQLLQSEYGGNPGEIMYRSRHWLKEISPDTKKAQPSPPQEFKKKVSEPVLIKNVRKGSPETAPKKKWQEKINPSDIKWASSWSSACTL